nr:hypothetical protein CFP56_78726 [Quercus suber]
MLTRYIARRTRIVRAEEHYEQPDTRHARSGDRLRQDPQRLRRRVSVAPSVHDVEFAHVVWQAGKRKQVVEGEVSSYRSTVYSGMDARAGGDGKRTIGSGVNDGEKRRGQKPKAGRRDARLEEGAGFSHDISMSPDRKKGGKSWRLRTKVP